MKEKDSSEVDPSSQPDNQTTAQDETYPSSQPKNQTTEDEVHPSSSSHTKVELWSLGQNKPSKFWLIAGLIFLAASFAIRALTIENAIFWFDEVITMDLTSGFTDFEAWAQVKDNVWTVKDCMEQFQSVHPNNFEQVISCIHSDHPLHAPLYFVLQYFWALTFGNSIFVARMLTLIFSILQLPAYYWLGIELTKTRLGGFICMMLIGLSPFMLHYAQQARPYTLMYFVFPLLLAVFLRAWRSEKKRDWILYCLIAVLSWYTSPLTAFLMASQFLFLLLQRLKVEKGEFTIVEIKRLVNPLVAMVVSAAAPIFYYLPSLQNIERIRQTGSGLSDKLTNKQLFDAWVYGPLSMYIQGSGENSFYSLLTGLIILSILLGIILIYKFGDRRILQLCVLMVIVVVPFFHVPDVIFGGIRSTVVKYMPGMFMTILFCTTYGFVLQMASKVKAFQLLGNFSLLCFLLVELGSSYYISTLSEREKFYGQSLRLVLQNIKTIDPDLIINSSFDRSQIFAIAHYLEPSTKILFTKTRDLIGLNYGVKRIVIFNANTDVIAGLKDRGYLVSKVGDIGGNKYLWRADWPEN